LNSLCRVLCTVRSLYLCAIGLVSVLSLARDIPRFSSCNSKKLYSLVKRNTHPANERKYEWVNYRSVTFDRVPFQATFALSFSSKFTGLCSAPNTPQRRLAGAACNQHTTCNSRMGLIETVCSFAITETIVVTFYSSAD